eukprot:g18180.t1
MVGPGGTSTSWGSDPFHIQDSQYFREADQVRPQIHVISPSSSEPRFNCDGGARNQARDFEVSSEAKLSYCKNRYCSVSEDLDTCCVLYEEQAAFNETAKEEQDQDATTVVGTLAEKRYYCNDAFTPSYYFSLDQAWAACNEYGVYCHGFQHDPTFLQFRNRADVNYTDGADYSVLLSKPEGKIPREARLSNETPDTPVKFLPEDAPSVSFTVHCAKVNARSYRNLTSGDTVKCKDDKCVSLWLKQSRLIDTSVKTAEDLGAVCPPAPPQMRLGAGGESKFRLRMMLPASGRTIRELMGVMPGAMSAALNARLISSGETVESSVDSHSGGGVPSSLSGAENFSTSSSLSEKLQYTGRSRRSRASALTSEAQGNAQVQVRGGHFVLVTTAIGNGSNVTDNELPLTEEKLLQSWDPLDAHDDVSGLFDTGDRMEFSLSLNLDHTGSGAPVLSEEVEAKLGEILTRYLHKHALREQQLANHTAMTNESVAVRVAGSARIEAAGGAPAAGPDAAGGGLVQEQYGSTSTAENHGDPPVDHGAALLQNAPTSMTNRTTSWCDLIFEPPNLTWQQAIPLIVRGQLILCVVLVLVVMRHRILCRKRLRPEQCQESDEWRNKVAQRQAELGLEDAEEQLRNADKLTRKAKRAASRQEEKENRAAKKKADKIVKDLRDTTKGNANIALRGGVGFGGASSSSAFGGAYGYGREDAKDGREDEDQDEQEW